MTWAITLPIDGMIMAVSLRRIYLILDRLLGWLLLLRHTSSSKDVELPVLRHDELMLEFEAP